MRAFKHGILSPGGSRGVAERAEEKEASFHSAYADSLTVENPSRPLIRAGLGWNWLDSVKCTEKESHVWKCPSQGRGQFYCNHGENAGATSWDMVSVLSTRWENGKSQGKWCLITGAIGDVCATESETSTYNPKGHKTSVNNELHLLSSYCLNCQSFLLEWQNSLF